MPESNNPVEIAKTAVSKCDLSLYDTVIIDTAGRLHIDEERMQELVSIKEAVNPAEILLVVDAMTGQDAVNVAESFNNQLDITGVVLSKLDSDTRGGAALSVRAVTGKPIKFAASGEKMDDIEAFHPDRMASRILGMGDVLTLIDKAQEAFDEKYAPTFPQPWPWFRKELDARLSPAPYEEIMGMNIPTYDPDEAIRAIFVSRMPNRKVTGAAHKETIRSAKMPGYSVVKTALTSLKLDSNGEIKDYYNPESDRLLYEALQNRLKQFGGDGKKAFTAPFYKPKRDGTPGPLVQKVKTYTKTNLNVSVNGGIADNGNMVRIDVFHIEDDGYYFVPIYTSDTVKDHLPNRAVVAHAPVEKWKIMQEKDFLFSLYPGDLIRVEGSKEINVSAASAASTGERELIRRAWMMYYTGANISSGAISGTTHDRKYVKDGLGIKTLRSIRKYEVDVLGEYHEVHLPEVRQTFR